MWIFGFKRLTVQQNFVSNYLVPVVLKVDTAILCTKHYPVDSAVIGFPYTYPPDRDLSDG